MTRQVKSLLWAKMSCLWPWAAQPEELRKNSMSSGFVEGHEFHWCRFVIDIDLLAHGAHPPSGVRGVQVVAPNGAKSQFFLLAARVELVPFHDCAKNRVFFGAC